MRPAPSRSRRLSAVLLVLLFAAAYAGAQGRDRSPNQEFSRFSLSMAGGFGFSENHRGLLDLQTELQFGLTPRLRLGLGVGYLNDHAGRGMDRGRNDQLDAFSGGMGYDGLRARIVPVSLNAYYGLPIGRKWTVFMSGGGSYYFGSFAGSDASQHRPAWGGQAGLGLEYRVAPRLQLFAEAAYRFVEFTGLTIAAATTTSYEQMVESLVSSTTGSDRADVDKIADYLKGLVVPLASKPARTADMNLSGLSLRMGVKFGL